MCLRVLGTHTQLNIKKWTDLYVGTSSSASFLCTYNTNITKLTNSYNKVDKLTLLREKEHQHHFAKPLSENTHNWITKSPFLVYMSEW